MQFERFEIDGPILFKPSRIGDARGWFSETFRQDNILEVIGDVGFLQHNQSMSAAAPTIRGLHFQIEPKAQGKLVRCLRGNILDVVVDIRRSSPWFGKHISAELTEENGHQLWVPPGFAHGFLTLVKNTEVFYLVTDYYSPAHDRGVLWNDPDLRIDWGMAADRIVISDKDCKLPRLRELPDLFA